MKIKILINDVERDVVVKLIGSDQQDFIKMMTSIAKSASQENVDPEKILAESVDFLNYQDKLLVDKSNLTAEEVANLDLEEKNKLVGEIRKVLLPWSDKGFF